MNLKFLLDTNVLSEPTRKQPNSRLLEKLARHHAVSATSSTVWNELWSGANALPESAKRTLVVGYLETLEKSLLVLPYDKAAAEWHAREQARLKLAGTPAPFADGQIAAVAATNDLTLVTDNTSDFRRFTGLKIENWYR